MSTGVGIFSNCNFQINIYSEIGFSLNKDTVSLLCSFFLYSLGESCILNRCTPLVNLNIIYFIGINKKTLVIAQFQNDVQI